MKKKIKNLVIFGAGSSGKETKLLVDEINKKTKIWKIIGFIDTNPNLIGKKIQNIKVYKNISEIKNKDISWICSVMSPKIKKKICKNVKKKYKPINLIHPSVSIPKDVKIGSGNIVFSNVHLSYEVKIKDHCMISFGSDVGHNANIDSFNSIMPGVIINGFVSIKNSCLVGSGAIINTNVKIESDVVIGSGTFVFENIKKKTSVFNLPRQIKKNIK